MNGEMKVGLFVIVGSVLFGTAIFLLGDYSFQKFYTVNAEFIDVAGLPDKSTVKLSGVEVGKIKRIYLDNEKKSWSALHFRGREDLPGREIPGGLPPA